MATGEARAPGETAEDREGERRQVTVLFADLSGFSELANALGAERVHALLNRFFDLVDGIIEGYGGTIDKHIGDNAMVVFGAPVAHTDDPERAVKAAFDVHWAVAGMAADGDLPSRSTSASRAARSSPARPGAIGIPSTR